MTGNKYIKPHKKTPKELAQKCVILLYFQRLRAIIPMLLKTENPVSCLNNQQGSEPNAMMRISSVSALLLCLRRLIKTRSTMDEREQKGLQIAATAKLSKTGELWEVPSQTANGIRYTVN